jgi:hypothetical protein
MRWPFGKNARKRAFAKSALSRFLPPDKVKELLETPVRFTAYSERKLMGYALVQLRDELELDEEEKLLNEALSTLGYRVTGMTSSVLLATFDEGPAERVKKVQELISRLGKRVRVLHGTEECLFGTFGTETFFKIGTLVPDFGAKLLALEQVEFGTAAEVSQPIPQ